MSDINPHAHMPTCLSWNSGTALDLQFPTEHPEIPPGANFAPGPEEAVCFLLCKDILLELLTAQVFGGWRNHCGAES